MITKRMLEECIMCSETMKEGNGSKHDAETAAECDRFLSFLQTPRDKHIIKLRFACHWSYELIAQRLALRDEGTVRKRINKLIDIYNSGGRLPACTTKDMLYGYYYSKKAYDHGEADELDLTVLSECDKFFECLHSSRHKQMCELRFVRHRSYQYIAMKLGYCDDGTVRRKINRIIKDYDKKI